MESEKNIRTEAVEERTVAPNETSAAESSAAKKPARRSRSKADETSSDQTDKRPEKRGTQKARRGKAAQKNEDTDLVQSRNASDREAVAAADEPGTAREDIHHETPAQEKKSAPAQADGAVQRTEKNRDKEEAAVPLIIPAAETKEGQSAENRSEADEKADAREKAGGSVEQKTAGEKPEEDEKEDARKKPVWEGSGSEAAAHKKSAHEITPEELVQRVVDFSGAWMEREPAGCAARMTSDLWPYDTMFSPIRINRMTVKNRIVMAPMGNISMADETGRPSERMLEYYFARAKGGCGLITSGLVPVSHGIDPTVTEKGNLSYFPRIDGSRSVLSGWRDLAAGCHAYGARFFIQLTPGLGRVGNPECLMKTHKIPRSSSFNPNFYLPAVPCIPFTDRKLRRIVKNTGQAAADAKSCGIDGVYLHGHEGYLLEQMTNTAFNHRIIGRYANWQQFGIDLVTEIRKRVGPRYPIMYRIDLSLALEETYQDGEMEEKPLRHFRGGRTPTKTLEYMKALVKAGVDIFDVDLGCYDNWWLPHPPATMPAGCYLPIACAVKEYFAKEKILSNAGVEIPIVGVGKLGYPDLAERALREGACDMVMLGRPLLADPDWPIKAYTGKVREIRPCIGCQEACINEFVNGGHPQCAVNPRTGFEHLYPETLPKAERVKNCAVVGAGPAGIVAALTLSARGHKVTLFEKSGRIGGTLLPAGTPNFKYDVANYRDYLADRLRAAELRSGFSLKLRTEATAASLRAGGYDAILLCGGSQPAFPPIPGIETVNALPAEELLRDPRLLGEAKKILIVGGGQVGCETALWLRTESEVESVTVVEMDEVFLRGICTANRGHLLHELKRRKVKLLGRTALTGFRDGAAILLRDNALGAPDPACEWQPVLPENIENPLKKRITPQPAEELMPFDLVLLAVGGRTDETLAAACRKNRIAPELYVVGDNFAPANVHAATRAAYRAAMGI